MCCGTPPAAGSADSCARACPRCRAWSSLFAHDLARKPVATFRDDAPLFERLFVVVFGANGGAGPLRNRRTLQELRRVLRRLAAVVARTARFAGGALGR